MAATKRLHLLVTIFLAFTLCISAKVNQIVAISHRGDNGNFPENTIPAFESAIKYGADFIEVDVRTTSDGFLVVIHDDTVDRTTNGTGRVRDFTLAEIRALDAGSWFDPSFAGLRVPTFAEVIALASSLNKDIYVDLKEGAADAVYKELAEKNMQADVVVYSGPARLKQLQNIDPVIKVMPEAVNVVVLNASIEFFDPLVVVAFNDNDFRDNVINLAKSVGADVYVDRLGSNDTPAVWQDAINRGATGIQTNLPKNLLDFLRENGYHD